ncbi:MAG: RNA polymerase sigma-70 factor [Tannerella sp.]|jgi:RNA polymerase sigma-70 factor (ECF subfamily)|nr:RNA polymerase sigma-70 factor [Tannerella sp.]
MDASKNDSQTENNIFNERNIIRELKSGSYSAFTTIYNMYAKRLFAFCRQYTKQVEDAEEIVQDVFVQLWNKRETIRNEESLRPLLFTIAKHQLINAYKSAINSPVYEDYVEYADKIADDNIHDRLEYEEFVAMLQRMLTKLPDTQRKVIKMSRLEGRSNKDIAEQLSLSIQTVKNQLSLGMKALQKILYGTDFKKNCLTKKTSR